jgi:hypothetical protein
MRKEESSTFYKWLMENLVLMAVLVFAANIGPQFIADFLGKGTGRYEAMIITIALAVHYGFSKLLKKRQ